ncbi:hypothetical protein KGM_204075 [Danaus plexippus plexippus]|uniref:Uncharacterized protein n=1 Tax=Danaus plexippus plexippus TaxID=278856 RepID=A0A212FHD0_DANPL|nr:hypothetical protein KGM_204075 [Danaus plexippus plexippus]
MVLCDASGLERVAEELMGRRKWKLYQDGLIPKRIEGSGSSDEDPSAAEPPPALKIKTIEEINAPGAEPARKETILETLIKRPAAQPRGERDRDEPADWRPADRCYFCVDGDTAAEEDPAAPGATLYNDQRPGAPSLHTDGLNAPDSPWPGDDGGSSYAGRNANHSFNLRNNALSICYDSTSK